MTELSLSPQEFWELTWYEWGLYVLRYKRMVERHQELDEIQWAHTRSLMAVVINYSFNRPDKTVMPQDIVPLSFDKKEEKQTPGLSFKEMKTMLGSRIKR